MLKIVFFASIREQLGTDSLQLDSALPADVGTLVDRLVEEHGELWHKVLREGRVLVAVNQAVKDMQCALQDGDEVAFFPPVTGG